MNRLFTIAGAAIASAAVMLPVTTTVQAADAAAGVVPSTVGSAMKYDHTDMSVFELSKLLPVDARQEAGLTEYEIPNQFGPSVALPRHNMDRDPLAADGQNPAASPTAGVSFDGPSSDDNQTVLGFRIQPPDTNGDVGMTHYVSYINLVWRAFLKDGTPVGGAVVGNSFWAGFGGPCESNNNGDPVVLYDHSAGRWVFTQFAPYRGVQCFAISDGEDPTVGYTRYAFVIEPTAFNDYPKLGLWVSEDGSQSAYTYTGRNFIPQSSPSAARDITAVMFDRDAMLGGGAANFTSSVMPGGFVTYDGAQPGHQDGGSEAPGGACPLFSVAEAPTTYRFFEFCENFPAAGTFTTRPTVTVPAFDDGLGDVALPGGDTVATLAFFTMYRASHKNVGGNAQLAMAHTVDAGGDRAGMRWAILDVDNYNAIALMDTGTHAPADGLERWMGSVTLDKVGNLGLGYTRGGGGQFPSVYYSGRETTDPAGTLQSEVACVTGTGSQTGGASRWGDYSSTSLDPADECTFWTTQEFVETTGNYQWNTRICSFSFPSCTGGGPVLTLSSAVPALAGQINTWTTTNGTPAERQALYYGPMQGSTQVSVGPCVNVTIDLGNARRIAGGVADASGTAMISRNIPAGAAGKNLRFQALDTATCQTSNVQATMFN